MKWWLKFLGSIGGALIGKKIACEVVFFNLAVRAYENDLERVIKAANYCRDEGGYGFGFFCFIVGSLAGYFAERRGYSIVALLVSLITAALAGVLSGFAYYVHWFWSR